MIDAMKLRAGVIFAAVSRTKGSQVVDATAIAAGAWACAVITIAGLFVSLPIPDSWSTNLNSWWPALWIPCISVGGLFAFVVTRLLVLAVLIRLWRGASAVEWRWPSECGSVRGWIGGTWKFENATGWHEGMRVLGLGLALQGALVSATHFD